jgi:hypothetical protein
VKSLEYGNQSLLENVQVVAAMRSSFHSQIVVKELHTSQKYILPRWDSAFHERLPHTDQAKISIGYLPNMCN